MKMPKFKYIGATLALMLVLATAGVGISHAATNGNAPQDRMQSLVTAIAKKFNLNTTEVQQVFDADRTQMEAAREQEQTSRINQAVTDDKLTQDQATKIIAKQKELAAARTATKNLSETERQTAMKTQMDSLKQWMTDNTIPAGYLPLGGPGMGHGPQGGHGQRGPGGPGFKNNNNAPAAAQNAGAPRN